MGRARCTESKKGGETGIAPRRAVSMRRFDRGRGSSLSPYGPHSGPIFVLGGVFRAAIGLRNSISVSTARRSLTTKPW